MENQNNEPIEIPVTREEPYVENVVNNNQVFEEPIKEGPTLAEQLDNPELRGEEPIDVIPPVTESIIENPEPKVLEPVDVISTIIEPQVEEPVIDIPLTKPEVDNTIEPITKPVVNEQPIIKEKPTQTETKSGSLLFLIILVGIIGGFIYLLPNINKIGPFLKDTYNNLVSGTKKEENKDQDNKKYSDNKTQTPITKLLNCTSNQYDIEYATIAQSTLELNFEDDKLTDVNKSTSYQYTDSIVFNEKFPETSINGSIVVNGIAMNALIDRENLTYTLTMSKKIEELVKNGWTLEEGKSMNDLSYNTILKSVQNIGFTCK